MLRGNQRYPSLMLADDDDTVAYVIIAEKLKPRTQTTGSPFLQVFIRPSLHPLLPSVLSHLLPSSALLLVALSLLSSLRNNQPNSLQPEAGLPNGCFLSPRFYFFILFFSKPTNAQRKRDSWLHEKPFGNLRQPLLRMFVMKTPSLKLIIITLL